jgi:dTDP-4-amino-4,6-dideoxygalactose transaminase
MDTRVEYYNLDKIHSKCKTELYAKAKECINSGNYVLNTGGFEAEFAEYTGAQYCCALNSGTSALHVALKALGIRPGDEVITVSATFQATVAAIKYCGATPVYLDIDPSDMTMDTTHLEDRISNKTKAIIPVHLYGNLCDMSNILTIANHYNIPVIEDCAHAVGTELKGQHAGTFGDIGCFSFYPGKGLGALGDAGCIITNDKHYYDIACKLRNWGGERQAYNYRMSNIQAEFLRIKLKHLDWVLAEKTKVANIYRKFLKSYIYTDPHVKHSFHIYPILTKNRDKIIASLANQVELKAHYSIPCHRLPQYKQSIKLPITEQWAKHTLSLPIYPGVKHTKVIEALNDYTMSFL